MADIGWSTNTDWSNAQSTTNIDINSETFELATAIPDSGVSQWTLDNADTENGTAIDSWGTNDGTINGPTTGAVGANQTYDTNEAYSFNSSNSDYVDVGNTITTTLESASGGTITAWVYPTDIGADRTAVGISSRTGNGNSELRYDNGNDVWWWSYADSNGYKNVTTGTPSPTTNNWFLLAGTFDKSANEIGISVNGNQFVTDTNHDGTDPNFNKPLKIGASFYSGNNFRFWDGRIDDVRVYNKSLTDSEINNLYNTGSIN